MKDDKNVLQKRIDECKSKGHIAPVWPEYRFDKNSSHPDTVRGLCNYCHQIIERPLTPEERKVASNYWWSISPEVINHNIEKY